jgi:hypothetical protein
MKLRRLNQDPQLANPLKLQLLLGCLSAMICLAPGNVGAQELALIEISDEDSPEIGQLLESPISGESSLALATEELLSPQALEATLETPEPLGLNNLEVTNLEIPEGTLVGQADLSEEGITPEAPVEIEFTPEVVEATETIEPVEVVEAVEAEVPELPQAAQSIDNLGEVEGAAFPDDFRLIQEAMAEADAEAAAEVRESLLAQDRALPPDVQPTDWAFDAVRILMNRYNCLVGYPDGTFRGDRAVSRFEFAAGLNACLSQILELTSVDQFDPAELMVIRRLQEDFQVELAAMEEALKVLDERLSELEGNQFSRNFKLSGEIALTLADAIGGGDTETVVTDRVRLNLTSSFIEEYDDLFIARLRLGDGGNSFADELGTNEGRFAFDGESNNDVTVDRIHYYFSPIDKLRILAMGNFGAHHFYADTLNPGLDVGGGANGALSRFAERNPIYRLGLDPNGKGAGLRYEFTPRIKVEAGYIAGGGGSASNPDPDTGGLFSGRYSALGQVVFRPIDDLKLAFTYVNTYDPSGNVLMGATGTNLINFASSNLYGGAGLNGVDSAATNSYGFQAQYDVNSKFSIRGWFGYTDVDLRDVGDANILNYAIALAFPNIGKDKALGGSCLGQNPM